MYLLDRTIHGLPRLTEFIGNEIPRYAILSHTWGSSLDEVSFKDVRKRRARNKIGYKKIEFCLDRAQADGLQYCWVDTCCIDKANLTELSEAINSMFQWYKNAEKCYAYLSDIPEQAFESSRWFARGWTLQELLAPSAVEFFSSDGTLLGDKQSLAQEIHKVTRIPIPALSGGPLDNFSIDEKMSWIAGRQTRREEDMAYSLLGLFEVSMPLIYGEGRSKADRRLRKHIQESVDHSEDRSVGLDSHNESRSNGSIQRSQERHQDHIEVAEGDENRIPSDHTASHHHGNALQISFEEDTDQAAADGVDETTLNSTSDTSDLNSLPLVGNGSTLITQATTNKISPLHSACLKGHLDIARLLLDRGADINTVGSDGWTPLFCACDRGHLDVVRLLLDNGVDMNKAEVNGFTSLNVACCKGHFNIVRLLLDKGADMTVANESGFTPLNSACYKGCFDVVRLLLDKGADLATVNRTGWTPLNCACQMGYLDIVRLLLDKGADITIANENGATPLNIACQMGHLDIVRLLLDKGADMTVANESGFTPLNSACQMGYLDIVRLLLDKGADMTVANESGFTPLNSACESGHLDVVQLLLDKGAN